MQLSRFTDYSLRVLLYLAINHSKRATLHEIADFYPLSLEHLRKVVHALAKSGYLRTFRGKFGGIELALEARDIRIGDVVRKFEGQQALLDCAELACRLNPACTLKAVLKEGQDAFFSSLNDYSLADLVGTRTDMVRLLFNEVA